MTTPPAAPSLRRRRRGAATVAGAALVGVLVVASAVYFARREAPRRCTEGLVPLDARCCGVGQRLGADRCVGRPTRCPSKLSPTDAGCVGAARRIPLAGGRLDYESVDWEAEGLAPVRAAVVAPFAIDELEVTWSRYAACVEAHRCASLAGSGEAGQPVSNVDADEAARFCAFAGGRLPTSDELLFAAAGREGRRFAWGPNGAVCRRAAWGLDRGPCGEGAVAPDLAGSHPEGRTPEGVEDLAGNVAEWTVPRADGLSEVRGGSFRDAEPSALKTWASRAVPAGARHDDIGFRCVYAP